MQVQKFTLKELFGKILGVSNKKTKKISTVDNSQIKSDFIPMTERGRYGNSSEEPFNESNWESVFDRKMRMGEIPDVGSDPSDSW